MTTLQDKGTQKSTKRPAGRSRIGQLAGAPDVASSMKIHNGFVGGGYSFMFGRNLEEKKSFIAKIAGEIFFDKGFKESSLHDISIKGNISKAGIYHYFKAKEDILSYILFQNTEYGIQALEDSLKKSEGQHLPPQESLRELLKTYAAALLKNRKNSLLVLRERHQLSGKSRQTLQDKERALFQLLKNQLRTASNINRAIDVNLVSFHILSSIHWMGYWFDEKGSISKAEAIDQTITIIFNGILNKKT
ncbi:MAG: TetR family transcriptional regulator [Syntrophales bacterium]|nr:TetR family transcriptional regulator [Syntrophales bacterium]